MALLPLDYKDIQIGEESVIPEKYIKKGANLSGFNLVFGDKARGLISGRIAEAVKAQIALLAASPAFRAESGVTSEEAAKLCANVLKRIGGMEGFDQAGNINWYMSSSKLNALANFDEILWREDYRKNADQEAENFPPTLYGSGRVNPS